MMDDILLAIGIAGMVASIAVKYHMVKDARARQRAKQRAELAAAIKSAAPLLDRGADN